MQQMQNGMTPETIAALMKIGAIPGQIQDQQGLLAQAMRAQSMPGPEGRQAGRTYHAANPLEHLGAGLQKFKGMRDQSRIEDQIAALRAEDTAARQSAADYINRMAGERRMSGAPGYADPYTGAMRSA